MDTEKTYQKTEEKKRHFKITFVRRPKKYNLFYDRR